jgi:virulence-associated protein VagC
MATAKVFQSGNSQAVRLPKEWPEDFWRAFEGMSPDFERPRQERQRRESLDA